MQEKIDELMKNAKVDKMGIYIDEFDLRRLKCSAKDEEIIRIILKGRNIRIAGQRKVNSSIKDDQKLKGLTRPELPEALSAEQNAKLFQQLLVAKTEEERFHIKEKIVEGNARLVRSIASSLAGTSGFDFYELQSYGYDGLMKAIEGYNLSKNVAFSTYAYPTIRFYIMDGIIHLKGYTRGLFYTSMVNVQRKLLKGIPKEEYDLLSFTNEIIESLIKEKSLSVEDIDEFRRKILIHYPLSLDECRNEVENIVDPEVNYTNYFLKEDVSKALLQLTDREQMVLRMLFGLDDGYEKTTQKIADKLNLSRRRICQIRDESLEKLRRPAKVKNLKYYWK